MHLKVVFTVHFTAPCCKLGPLAAGTANSALEEKNGKKTHACCLLYTRVSQNNSKKNNKSIELIEKT